MEIIAYRNANDTGNKSSGPDRVRTCGPKFRKLVLYPTELRNLILILTSKNKGLANELQANSIALGI